METVDTRVPPQPPPVIAIDDWRRIYANLCILPLGELLDTPGKMGGASGELRVFFQACTEMEARQGTQEPRVYRALMDVAGGIGVAMTANGIHAMENRFSEVARRHHCSGYSRFGAARWLLMDPITPRLPTMGLLLAQDRQSAVHEVVTQAAADTPRLHLRGMQMEPRYVWSTMFAYLWACSADVVTPPEQWDIVIICAQFAGDPFTVFACMLLALNKLTRVLPPRMSACLHTYLEMVDRTWGGQVPPEFIHQHL